MAPDAKILWIDRYQTGHFTDGVPNVPDDTDLATVDTPTEPFAPPEGEPLDIEDQDFVEEVNGYPNYTATYEADRYGCEVEVRYRFYPEGKGAYGTTPFREFSQCRLPDDATEKIYVDDQAMRRVFTDETGREYVRLTYDRVDPARYPHPSDMTSGTVTFLDGGKLQYDPARRLVTAYDENGKVIAWMKGQLTINQNGENPPIPVLHGHLTIDSCGNWVSGSFTYFLDHQWGSIDSVDQLFVQPNRLIPATPEGREQAVAHPEASGVTVSNDPIPFNIVTSLNTNERSPLYPFSSVGGFFRVPAYAVASNANYFLVDETGRHHLLYKFFSDDSRGGVVLFPDYLRNPLTLSNEHTYTLVAEVDTGWRFGDVENPQRMAAELTVYPLVETKEDVAQLKIPVK